MKTFQIRIQGTPEEVKAFTNFLPNRTIESMTGLLPSHTANPVHRFVRLNSDSYLEIGDLVDKIQQAASTIEPVETKETEVVK